MSEANKTVVRRIVEEVWNERKHDRIDEFYATDFVNTDPSCPEVKNLEQFKEWLTEIHKGAALLRRPLLTVCGSLYCFILDKFTYLITFR